MPATVSLFAYTCKQSSIFHNLVMKSLRTEHVLLFPMLSQK